MESDILNVQETAEFLKFNTQTIRRLAREGQIPAFRVGGNWRFRKSDLNGWFKSVQRIPEPPPPQKQILVVDDEPSVRFFLKSILEAHGFSVVTADDGLDALEKLRQRLPDLVFLDLKMPRMDGAEFFENLHVTHPNLPVIVVTGYPDGDLMMRALKFSPLLVLVKPAATEQVLKAARNALASENKKA